MGTDAHSGAVLRHWQGGGQLQTAALQTHCVLVHPGAGQNVFAAGQPCGGGAAGGRKYLFGRTGAQHTAFVQNHHIRAQAVGFVPIVGHQQSCTVKSGQQTAHLALHLFAQVAVQCTERLVQHQEPGLPDQNARQCGALLLSAGKFCRAAGCQPFQPHGTQHFCTAGFAGCLVSFCLQPAEDVLLHGHIGEKGVILEQQTHPALLRRQVDMLFTVKQHPAVQYDAAFVRFHDARDAAQGHAFAAAGCPQQSGGRAACGKPGLKGEAVQLFLNAYFQTHFRPPAFCFFSRRFTASSTTAEITISTSTHRMAPASSLVRQSWYTVVAMVAVLPGV